MPTNISVNLQTNGNDAFVESPGREVARILREAAKRIENGEYPEGGFRLNDVNGHKCGDVLIEVEDE